MVTEHVLPRSIQDIFGFYQVYRAKKSPTRTSPVDLTLSSSSQLDLSCSNTASSNTSSSVSASISSDISSSSSDNTLNMISTPWTTETWSEESMVGAFETYSDPDLNTVPYTSSSLHPVSTTASGGITLDINSASGNTVTILEMNEPRSCFSINLDPVPSECKTPIDKRKYSGSSYSTFDSWTVESFTSFVEYSDSNIVKVRYPWSPSTCQSGTDIYPDSLDTLALMSAFSLKSPTLDSVKQSADNFTSAPKCL